MGDGFELVRLMLGVAAVTGLFFVVAAFFGAAAAKERFGTSAVLVSRRWKLSWLIRLLAVAVVWLVAVFVIINAVEHLGLGMVPFPVLVVIGSVAVYRLSVFIGRLDFRSVPAATTA